MSKNNFLIAGVLAVAIVFTPTMKANAQTYAVTTIEPTDKEIITDASDKHLIIDKYAELYDLMKEYSDKYDIPYYILSNLIYNETRYKNVSRDQYVGLMQVNKNIHQSRANNLGWSDISDPEANIDTGCNYLRELYDKYIGEGFDETKAWAYAISKYHGESDWSSIAAGDYSYYTTSILQL